MFRLSLLLPRQFDGALFGHAEQRHLSILRYRGQALRLIEGERSALPSAQVVRGEQEKMCRAFIPLRPGRNDPDRRGSGVHPSVDVEVVGDRHAAVVGPEIGGVFVLPHPGLKLAEIVREAPGLPVVRAQRLDQAVNRQSRRLLPQSPGFQQCGGRVGDDHRRPECHERHVQPACVDRLVHSAASLPDTVRVPEAPPKSRTERPPSVEFTSSSVSTESGAECGGLAAPFGPVEGGKGSKESIRESMLSRAPLESTSQSNGICSAGPSVSSAAQLLLDSASWSNKGSLASFNRSGRVVPSREPEEKPLSPAPTPDGGSAVTPSALRIANASSASTSETGQAISRGSGWASGPLLPQGGKPNLTGGAEPMIATACLCSGICRSSAASSRSRPASDKRSWSYTSPVASTTEC